MGIWSPWDAFAGENIRRQNTESSRFRMCIVDGKSVAGNSVYFAANLQQISANFASSYRVFFRRVHATYNRIVIMVCSFEKISKEEIYFKLLGCSSNVNLHQSW
jgi:hypothetical protein